MADPLDPERYIKADPPGMTAAQAEDWNAKQMSGVFGLADGGLYLGEIKSADNPNAPFIVAEGIESALALAASGAAGIYYAAGSLGKLVGKADDGGGWVPPNNSRAVLIGADNDLSPVPNQPCGIARAEIAFNAARRRLERAGYTATVAMPPPGLDWNDVLLRREPVPCTCSRCQSVRGTDCKSTPQDAEQGQRAEPATSGPADGAGTPSGQAPTLPENKGTSHDI